MKKIFFLYVMLFSATLSDAQVTDGLIAYYPFNGNANDASSNANNGTVNGATLTIDRFGNANSAYLFNGSGSYIYIPNSASLQSPGSTNRTTQTAWIYLNGMSNVGSPDGPITMKSDNGANSFMYRMIISGGSALVASYIDWYHPADAAFAFNLHTWYFLVTTYDGSVGKCYVNGTLIGSKTLNLTIPTDNLPLTIGRDAPGSEEYFNGIIDEVRIYKRALSQEEINTLAKDLPSASISNKGINEGNSGTSIMNFKLTLSHALDTIVKIKYRTADNTAKAGSDYVAKQGIISFQPGQTSKNIAITINGDVTPESNEKFKVALSGSSNAMLLDSVGIGTIKNDDVASIAALNQTNAVDIESAFNIQLSPNPARNTAQLAISNASKVNIILTDLSGKVLWKKNATGKIIQLPLQNLANGIYAVIVSNGKQTKTLKLVKVE